ncbi:copper resistance D family protein [Mangrovibacillus cuniculi]|uniref:Copper resistance protein D domain-containing protein n=1 Tax=Mangrovibacillus cuniculi TaxID=2593652 RepID=A0A7S8HF86_9BACI|nr:CopD family protein [Mangrovibacillus cuniculi]QPC46507.1 hypothetical protein G8O30_05770 [Mangrovibacillus cuniculi]
MISIVAKLFTYGFLSFLAGYYVLSFISEDKKPTLVLQKKWALLAIAGLILSSTGPLLDLIIALTPNFGFQTAVTAVLFEIQVGQTWWVLVIFALFLLSWTAISKSKSDYFIALVLFFGTIFSLTISGHPNSMANIYGSIYHTLHYVGVVGWIGVLGLVSWFAKDTNNWSAFLKWYSPTASGSFVLTVGTGIAMMISIVPLNQYADSIVTPYGSAMLLKHLSIIPLLYYAFINGPLTKRWLKKNSELPVLKSIKIEFVVVTFILLATSVMSTSSPPHEVNDIKDNLIPWASFFQVENIQLEWNIISSIYGVLAAILFIASVIALLKRNRAIASILLSVMGVISGYISLLFAI